MKRPLTDNDATRPGEQGLSVFLIFLLVYVVTLIPLAGLTYGRLAVNTAIAVGFVASFRLFFRSGVKRRLAAALVFAALSLLWVSHFFPSATTTLSRSFLLSLLWGLLATEILRHVLGKGPITWHRIRGAVSIYLFFGLILAEFYRALATFIPGSFQLPLGVEKNPELLYAQMVYFSFITQTTLGYGDIVPLHPIARMLVVLQALVGQSYPATVMAWLVSQEVIHRNRNP